MPPALTRSLARSPHTEIIDGKETAATIRQELKAEVDGLKAKCGKVPGLAVVLVGERKDSQTYVRNKKKACEEVGIVSYGTVGTWLAVSLPARERPHSLARSFLSGRICPTRPRKTRCSRWSPTTTRIPMCMGSSSSCLCRRTLMSA